MLTLPVKYISFNVVILGEVWKIPCDKHEAEWKDNIDISQLGNFIHVKDGILPTFEKSLLSNGKPETTVVFGKNVICKLHPVNEQQYKNFYCKTTNKKQENQIYYYAFNKVDDWKTIGWMCNCAECTNKECKKMACTKHIDLEQKPKEFHLIHLCGYDYENRICLLSHRQMIVNSFLKTGSTKPIHSPSEYVDDDEEDLIVRSKL